MTNTPQSTKPYGFNVGTVHVWPPLLLAPMEAVTNRAFRRIAKRIGDPGMMFTEFVSSMAIHYGAAKTLKKMHVHGDERPLGVQIFGGDADVMAKTAAIAEELGADVVDINMGCWVPKVCRTGSGAALLKDPEHAARIVSAVVKAVKVPVTVKVRAGWDYSLFAAPDLARRFQDVGARMITLHARFAKQGFEGQADWQLISDMRKAVQVPLIGNGDVKTPDDALRMMRETGCDGVMVGRAAVSNPWALARIRAGIVGEPIPPEPTISERVQVALEHARLMIAEECDVDNFADAPAAAGNAYATNELRAMRSMRGQLPLYIKGIHGAAQLRGRISSVSGLSELEDVLHSLGDI